MKKISKTAILLVFILIAWPCFADSIRISQIDSLQLLVNQEVKLYLSVTDKEGIPIENLEAKHFSVFESSGTEHYLAVPEVTGFAVGPNYEKGTSFLLLIDNSGSMYRTMAGIATKKPSLMRITQVKKAVKTFLRSVTNPADKIGLAVYNSNYTLFSKLRKDKVLIEEFLDQVKRPQGDEVYTEIYGSLALAVEEFRTVKGRKALIILSDGENSPYFTNTKKPHPQFGKQIIPYRHALDALQVEGISLYTIYFGKKGEAKDKHLATITTESGGVTFDAYNKEELEQVYLKIMDQIIKEYVLTYKATMEPAEKKSVQVRFVDKQGETKTARRFYFSGGVFGKPGKENQLLAMIVFAVAAILLWALTKIKFEKQRKRPNLEILRTGLETSTRVLDLKEGQTVIGSSFIADMTIQGSPAIMEDHATIAYDQSTDQYTLVGHGNLMVNNQTINKKVLQGGDVINIDGTIMVFDEGKKTKGN